MAKKKKAARSKVEATSVVSRLQTGMKTMRRDAEALLGRARKEAARLSREQKKALGRAGEEVRRVRTDLQKFVKRSVKELETRSARALATLEKDVEKRLAPVVKRMVGPSQQELRSLTRRVHQLEEQLKGHAHSEASASSPAPTSAPASDI
ncbi:MAG TPA: hypothetical protein VMW17_05370 [Candidatus Binatia bacterium]|nr:hypothetical protein [Candidatus Binatia bacterium]